MMIEYSKKVFLENFSNFKGRARRSEFWYFWLMCFIISFIIGVMEGALGWNTSDIGDSGFNYQSGPLGSIFSLIVFIPSLACSVRRLHDTDRSGWYLLLWLIPIVGWIILLVFHVQEGNAGSNQYGPDPKNPELSAEDHFIDDEL